MKEDKKAKMLQKFFDDPHAWATYFWPDLKLYDKQLQTIESVRDNKETFVHAANKMGKTFVAALICLWWYSSRFPARVIASSPTESQLRDVLFAEIGRLIREAKRPMGITAQDLFLYSVDNEGKRIAGHYVRGHVTNSVESFQGHHLDFSGIPRVLFLFDEASGVADDFYDAAQSQAHRLLAIGNPLNTTNFYFRNCKLGDIVDPFTGNSLSKKVIHISADDSPNVKVGKEFASKGIEEKAPNLIPGVLTYEEYLFREQNWNDQKKHTRLKGLFWEGDDSALYPPSWIDECQSYWPFAKELVRGPCSLGVDVAGGGRDESAWYVIDPWGVVFYMTKDTPNTMEIPAQTIKLMKKYKIPASRVAFDAGGGGKQIADRMVEMGYYCMVVNFGEAALDRKSYFNRRAEMYGRLRDRMNPASWERDDEGEIITGFAIDPHDHLLREELQVMPLSSDSEGRLKLPPKEKPRAKTARHGAMRSIKEMLGRSPDRCDALVLANYVSTLSHANYIHAPTVDDSLLMFAGAEHERAKLKPKPLRASSPDDAIDEDFVARVVGSRNAEPEIGSRHRIIDLPEYDEDDF